MADLKFKIQEQLVLNGIQQGGSYEYTINNVNDVYKRIITVPSQSNSTLATFKSTVSTGSVNAMDLDQVKYIRVTNLNSSNHVNLSLQLEEGNDDSSADSSATIKLKSKGVFLLNNISGSLKVNDSNANIMSSSLANLGSIIANSSGSVQLEVFIAS